MKTLPLLFAAVLASLTVTAAQAASPDREIRQKVVSYADLNLDQGADAQTLYQWIKSAARDVCGTPSVLMLSVSSLTKSCAEDATERAIADVNAPSLTRYQAKVTHARSE